MPQPISKPIARGNLAAAAPEDVDSFLLNHLIAESLSACDHGSGYANADPVTGRTAWFDLRMRIEPDKAPSEPGDRILMIAEGNCS